MPDNCELTELDTFASSATFCITTPLARGGRGRRGEGKEGRSRGKEGRSRDKEGRSKDKERRGGISQRELWENWLIWQFAGLLVPGEVPH